MELHMSALQAKQEGESMLKQQIMELSSKVDELQDDLYKQQAFGESLQVERDELRETLTEREQNTEQEAELERMRESMAALSQVLVHGRLFLRPPARAMGRFFGGWWSSTDPANPPPTHPLGWSRPKVMQPIDRSISVTARRRVDVSGSASLFPPGFVHQHHRWSCPLLPVLLPLP